ncbi:MAG: protein tyrosine phosphatase family protein [Thiobacillus sp.]|nr:protein tyrosine phosphatase family protein [Thiobacillus sp.]
MDAENTHRVFDWLWSSGQLSETDIARLPGLGFDAVINLALPSSSNALAGEADYVTREGLDYVQIPVEWEHPELDQLIRFFGVLKAYEGRKTWVHCARNMRVSAFVFLYRRLCLAESPVDAMHPLKAVWRPNPVWQQFIDRVLGLGSDPAYNWATYKRAL